MAHLSAKVEVPSKDDLRLPTPGAIPRHPGHNWDDPAFRTQHNRRQVLKAENAGKQYGLVASGQSAPINELPSIATGPAARLHGSIQRRVADASATGFEDDGAQATTTTTATSMTKYDLKGRKLTFKAYFTERVPESAIEKVRTRFVNINFFLEDETIAVFEPTIPSSGLQAGYLLRRTKAPLTETDAGRRAPAPTDCSRFPDLARISEKHITILDFNVGRALIVFGTEYYLHACDDFTRTLLTTLGVAVGPDEGAPEDAAFATYRQKMTGASATLPNSARLDPMRQSRSLKSRQYGQNAGIVLRFYCTWDEETSDTCEHREHRFELHYFMEDDSISLRERESTATGGEIIARHFLKRIKLPKSGIANDGALSASSSTPPQQFYGPRDFAIGAKVNAYGRTLVLVDSDDATRKYYAENFGVELGAPIIVSTTKPKPPELIKAASTALALLTREPPKPRSTLILKYELTLADPETADDSLRRFVLTFYAGDGEIAIGELVQRNSGFAGGRVLKKSTLLKSDGSGRAVGIPDLVEGAHLKVYGRNFIVSRLSPRAEWYHAHLNDDGSLPDSMPVAGAAAAAAPGEEIKAVPKERVKELINKFRDHMLGRYVTLNEAFNVLDQDRDGRLTEFELRMFLAKHAISTNEAEAVALIAVFNPNGDGEISYQEFCQAVTYGARAREFGAGELEAGVAKCRATANRQVLTVAHRVLLDKLRDKLEVRHMNVFEMFRAMATMPRKWAALMTPDEYAKNGVRVTLNALTNAEKDCVVTPIQFRRVLTERLSMNVSKSEMAVLLSCFYPDLPESEFNSTEDVDALPPRALHLEDMHRILCSNLRS